MNQDDIILKVGEHEAKINEYGSQIATIFEKVDGMKESLDMNLAHAKYRDEALAAVQISVANIDHKIENGLRKTINEILIKVEAFGVCLEKRKAEREQKEKKTWGAMFQESWLRFKREFSYIIIIFCFCSISWIIWKLVIFEEAPQGILDILKFFK